MVFIDNVNRLCLPTFAQISVSFSFFEANITEETQSFPLFLFIFQCGSLRCSSEWYSQEPPGGILARKIVPQISPLPVSKGRVNTLFSGR